MESQDALLSMLENESIIEALSIPAEMSIEHALDARDADEFSQQWMAAFSLIEACKRGAHPIQADLSAEIRKAAYLHAYSRWKSPDLAACISDDFGLIATAAAVGIDEPWIAELLRTCRKGKVPGT